MGECILSRVSGGSGKKILLNQSAYFYAYSNWTPTDNTLFQYDAFSASQPYFYLYKTAWKEIAHLVSSSSGAITTFTISDSTNSYNMNFCTNQTNIEGILNDRAETKFLAYKIEKDSNGKIALYFKLTDSSSWDSIGFSLGRNTNYTFWIMDFMMLPLN